MLMQLLLHLLPQLTVNDGLVLSRMADPAVTDLTYVKRIGEVDPVS
jgi:hypothetical protein